MQIILFTGDYILCGIFSNRLKGNARGDGKEKFFSFPSPLALPSVTPLVTGHESLSGVANVPSAARSLKVPLINEQTSRVVKDTLSTE